MNTQQAVRENGMLEAYGYTSNYTQWVHPGQMKDWIWFFVGIPHQHFHPQLRQMRGKYDKARRGLGTHGALPSGVEEVHRGGQVVIIIDWEHFFMLFYRCLHWWLLPETTDCFICVRALNNVSFVMFSGEIATIWSSPPSKSAARSTTYSVLEHHLLAGNLHTLMEDTYVVVFFFFYQQQIQRISISGCSTSKDKDPLSSVPLSSSICHGSVSFPAPLGGKKKSFFMQLKGSTLPPVAVRRADA